MKHLFTNIYITTHILQRRNLGKILNLFLGDDTNIWVKLSNLGKLCLIKLLLGFNFNKPPQTPSIPSNDFGNNECDFQKYFPFVVALNWIFAQRSFYHVYSFFFFHEKFHSENFYVNTMTSDIEKTFWFYFALQTLFRNREYERRKLILCSDMLFARGWSFLS